ncbi:unnamed protein product [Phaedon cochleariae]|uniref:YqaJ viral recombinase domain-containing protein n=1 Tax=Phaedon cochleariae TaxID=80249 RepID=A0A9N9SL87_PHACE|nr:unnamed protein product [Phaedon cochleariae]
MDLSARTPIGKDLGSKQSDTNTLPKVMLGNPEPGSVLSPNEAGLPEHKIRDILGNYLQCFQRKSSISKDLKNSMNCLNDTIEDRCLYYGYGRLNFTVDWIECEKCKGWIHVSCDTSSIDIQDDVFTCKFCSVSPNKNLKTISLRSRYSEFLEYLEKKSDDKIAIEASTRNQRDSPKWFEERRMRVTASNFGSICKARSVESKLNIVQDLLSQDVFSNAGTRHGVDNEPNAIQEYLKIHNKFTYQRCDLLIHNEYYFLGASPDGLLDLDGVLEVKCPHSIRNENPNNAKLPYLDIDGKLKISSDHQYFQIQGILEITNRPWCDFVMYTFEGINVERVHRNMRFFKPMIKRLQEFYYFFYLPNLLGVAEYMRWRPINEITLLDNGLVSDIEYYKKNPKEREYSVAKFNDLDLCVSELMASDFLTLDGEVRLYKKLDFIGGTDPYTLKLSEFDVPLDDIPKIAKNIILDHFLFSVGPSTYFEMRACKSLDAFAQLASNKSGLNLSVPRN